MADRFPFMRVYAEMAEQLSKEDRADFYDALVAYALDGTEPAPSTGAAVFQAARRMIDKWRQTSAAGKARASKTAGRSLDGRWIVAGSEKPADCQKSKNAGSEKPAKGEKDKRIRLYKSNNINNNNSLSVSTKTPAKKDSAAEAAAVRPQDVVDLYNGICRSLPKVAKITDERRRHINARLKEHPPEDFRRAFEKAEASDFLSGRAKDWQATFDWIIGSPDHFQRILEGVYDDKPKKDAVSTAGRLADALIQSADPEAVAAFEESMNGGFKT